MSTAQGYGTLLALLAIIAVSVWLGALAQRVVERGAFLKGFFIGNRGLGAWALALTATVQSGGTFMGFPSLVYSHGWIVALWIGSYMAVPLTGFAVLGKRLAQLSRRTGAITLPDLLRERYASPAVGLTASLLLMFFMSAMMVAQFKAGAMVMKNAWPSAGPLAFGDDVALIALGWRYYLGLAIFSATVIGYTLIGGFLASVWTDLFQSVLMIFGVVILLALTLNATGGVEQATRDAVANTGSGFVFGPGYSTDGRAFLPLSLAFSFFVLWVWTGVGSPASLVRVMATKDTPTLRRSVVVLSLYNLCIYPPLIVIAVAARALMPDFDPAQSDEMIPRMALLVTGDLPLGSLVAGLILAAPFGAVMATVSTYLVVISSGIVRDVYQRFLHPEASDRALRRVSHVTIGVVGAVAVGANIYPVDYLQALVVFSSSGAGSSFLVPVLMACYWRRATRAGAIAAMAAGSVTVLGLFIAGPFLADQKFGQQTNFRPYFLAGLEPVIWGLAASFAAGILVSRLTPAPPADVVARLFDRS